MTFFIFKNRTHRGRKQNNTMKLLLSEHEYTLKQLQKLTKELGPVRTALSTLRKREGASPHLANTVESLKKIVTRLDEVILKYTPHAERFRDLAWNEYVNAAVLQQLLATQQQRGSAPEPITTATTTSTTKQLDPEALSTLSLQQQMRMDMVQYLIATGRPSVALKVAQAYRLPLHVFPELVSGPRGLWSEVYSRLPEIKSGKQGKATAGAGVDDCMVQLPEQSAKSTADEPGTDALASAQHIASARIVKAHSLTEALDWIPAQTRGIPLEDVLTHDIGSSSPHWALRLCVEMHLVRIHQLKASGETPSAVVDYIAAHVLPYATVFPQMIQLAIRSATTDVPPVAAIAQLMSQAGFAQLADGFIRLAPALPGLVRRAEAKREQEEAKHTPLPPLIARVVLASLARQDEFVDDVCSFKKLGGLDAIDATMISFLKDAITCRVEVQPTTVEGMVAAYESLSTSELVVKGQTQLVCPVTGVTMDGTIEPAYALPSGVVVSGKACGRQGTATTSDSGVMCPKTHHWYPTAQLKRVFLL